MSAHGGWRGGRNRGGRILSSSASLGCHFRSPSQHLMASDAPRLATRSRATPRVGVRPVADGTDGLPRATCLGARLARAAITIPRQPVGRFIGYGPRCFPVAPSSGRGLEGAGAGCSAFRGTPCCRCGRPKLVTGSRFLLMQPIWRWARPHHPSSLSAVQCPGHQGCPRGACPRCRPSSTNLRGTESGWRAE